MFWICIFALIMEIVFRAQNNVHLNSSSKNKSLNQGPELVFRATTNANLPVQPPDESVLEDSLTANTLLDLKSVVYLIRNANDGSILTASATLSENCVYLVSAITSTRSELQDSKNWLRFTDDSHQELTTQLWEISNVGKTIFLQPAAIAGMEKWILRDPNPQPPTNGDSVSTQSDTESIVAPQPPSDLGNVAYVDIITTTTTTTTPKINLPVYNYDNNNRNDESRHVHHRKHHFGRKPSEFNDGEYNFRNKRNLDYHRYKVFSSQRSQPLCDLNGSKIVWKSQWELVDNEVGSNLKSENFQIRDSRGKCVQSGGFIGICPQRRLESDSNTSWQFQPVADLGAINPVNMPVS